MKNRMYYLLLPVYLFVVGFVLIVNGVFTGQVMSVSNLVINLMFLLLIPEKHFLHTFPVKTFHTPPPVWHLPALPPFVLTLYHSLLHSDSPGKF